MVVREVIEVARPPAEAFAYVADFTTAAEWDPGIAASRRLSGEGGVGTRYEVFARFRGKELPFAYTVTELVEGRRIVLEGVGTRALSRDTIEVERSGEGSRISYTADIRMRGAYRLAEPFLRGTFRSLGAQALAGLKKALDRST